jgi:Zn-dependent M28 family amino/carboxypeptidase
VYNVVARLPGTDSSAGAVIFSAHYDHIGTASTNPNREYRKKELKQLKDTIYNGANDNASGTSALICLARYYGQLKNNKRTIIFIAFSGEEFGLVGSSAMAASIKNPGSIACMINLEMLGRGSSPFLTGSELGNTRDLLNTELARIDVGRFKKRYFKQERYPEQMLFKRSDNFPFAQLRIPAHTVMSSDQDPYYHSFEDGTAHIELWVYQQITQAVALAMKPIIGAILYPGLMLQTIQPIKGAPKLISEIFI